MRYSKWTLRTRLIALTTVLVAVTSIVLGGVMCLVVRNSLSSNLDNSLQASMQRLLGPHEGVGGGLPYLDVGTIAAAYPTGGGTSNGLYSSSVNSNGTNLTSAQLKEISASASSRVRDGATTDVDVTKYGMYRFIVTTQTVRTDAGFAQYRIVVGSPLSTFYRQFAAFVAFVAGVVIVVVILSALIGAILLRRALRPLRRVAAVASNVADMPLERGEVQLAQRVPEEDTNPHTEVGQVGSALNALLDSVQSALAVRQASEEKVRTFVADASHELRTPLASIRGYAELTRRFGGDLDDTVQHNIGRIESEAQRMTSLVEDLLLLARLDAERELDRVEVDLSRILLDVLSDAHAAGPDHRWDIELPEEPVSVYGDDAKLHQVFTNLLANARVHTPAGTRVSVELQDPKGDSAVVIVRDAGPGIPEALQPKLFERFARGDSSRNRATGSTGLGLSIVQAVVSAHHGSVDVTSKPGETVFTVRLPLHRTAPRKDPVPA